MCEGIVGNQSTIKGNKFFALLRQDQKRIGELISSQNSRGFVGQVGVRGPPYQGSGPAKKGETLTTPHFERMGANWRKRARY